MKLAKNENNNGVAKNPAKPNSPKKPKYANLFFTNEPPRYIFIAS